MASDIQNRHDSAGSDTWIEGVRQGMPGVLIRLVESLRPFVKKVANRELDRDLRAEASVSDLVQETLFDAQRDIEKFRGRSEREFKSWLVGILRNKLKDFRRRLLRARRDVRREIPLSEDTQFARSDVSSPSVQAIRQERQQLVRVARARLAERDRNVVAWYHDDGCTFEEIGRRLGCSVVSARAAWLRALKKLAGELSVLQEESNAGIRPAKNPMTRGTYRHETGGLAKDRGDRPHSGEPLRDS